MYGYIYKLTNLINHKSYIGKHKYDKPVLDEHYVASGTLINQSIKKYGLSNFSNEIVDIANDAKTLNELEVYYIKQFNTRVPNGYNLTAGGDGVVDPSLETREKMAFWKGKKQPEYANEKRSQTLKKVIHTEEWVDKIRQSNKGQRPSEHCIAANKRRKTGSSWYNNGVEEHMFLGDDIPDGYTKGRLKNPFPDQRGKPKSEEVIFKISEKRLGLKWCNNGYIEKMVFPDDLPEGFVFGRLK